MGHAGLKAEDASTHTRQIHHFPHLHVTIRNSAKESRVSSAHAGRHSLSDRLFLCALQPLGPTATSLRLSKLSSHESSDAF
jgi:hypothetical protein